MSILLQNLRSITPGVAPATLSPGQLCFNLADEVMFVGDGSNTKKNFGGPEEPTTPGGGWFSIPLSLSTLNDFFLVNPEYYGDIPTDKDVLTWNSSANRPVWSTIGGIVYLTTNAAVAAAPGITVTEKINAVNVDIPLEGDTTIVVGTPGQTYEGLYFYDSPTAQWVLGAHYAYPEAVSVPYDNTTSGLASNNVQGAIDNIAGNFVPNDSFTAAGDLLVGTGAGTYTALADGAANYILQSNGDGTLSWVVNSAGDVTGVSGISPITVDNTNPQTPVVEINAASTTAPGAVQLNDTVNSTSTTVAATANSVKTTYDLANAALPKSGGTMTGDIVFNNGQLVDAGTY